MRDETMTDAARDAENLPSAWDRYETATTLRAQLTEAGPDRWLELVA
jgi:hypothetical protein